jgi:hypothetical protein
MINIMKEATAQANADARAFEVGRCRVESS